MAAIALDPVQGSVRSRDELGRRPAVGGNVATPIDALIGTGPRCSPTNGLVAECLEDALGRPARLVVRRSRAG